MDKIIDLEKDEYIRASIKLADAYHRIGCPKYMNSGQKNRLKAQN